MSRRATALRLAPALVVVLGLFGGALAGAISRSLTPPLGGGPSTWSLDAWRALLADPIFRSALASSARTAGLATALAVALALPLAWALRARGPAIRGLATLPVGVPHALVGVTAVLWLAPGGMAERLLGGLPIDLVRDSHALGVVAVYVYKETPFLVLLMLAAMGEELRRREELAATLGLGALRRLTWVVWPAVRSPLTVGALVLAAYVFGAFEVPLAIGPNDPPALAEYAWQATQGDALTGGARAAAALLVAAATTTVLGVAAVRLARGMGSPDG